VKTGIQEFQAILDSRLRGSDDLADFLRHCEGLFNRVFFVEMPGNMIKKGKRLSALLRSAAIHLFKQGAMGKHV